MTKAELLRSVAYEYFHPEHGDALILVDEFNHTPVYVDGHTKGLSDAYHVLLGLSDRFREDEKVTPGELGN